GTGSKGGQGGNGGNGVSCGCTGNAGGTGGQGGKGGQGGVGGPGGNAVDAAGKIIVYVPAQFADLIVRIPQQAQTGGGGGAGRVAMVVVPEAAESIPPAAVPAGGEHPEGKAREVQAEPAWVSPPSSTYSLRDPSLASGDLLAGYDVPGPSHVNTEDRLHDLRN